MSNTKIKGIESSLRAFASMRVLRVFASTTSDQIQLTSGDHFVFSAGSKVPDVLFITSYRDPGYDMYNSVHVNDYKIYMHNYILLSNIFQHLMSRE